MSSRRLQQELDMLMSFERPNKSSTTKEYVKRERVNVKNEPRLRVRKYSESYPQREEEIDGDNASEVNSSNDEEEKCGADEPASAWSEREIGYQNFVEVESQDPRSSKKVPKEDIDDELSFEEDYNSLNEINARCANIERQNELLIKSQKMILRQLLVLRKSTASRNAHETVEPEYDIGIPAATVSDFEELEVDCMENKETEKYMKKLFSNIIHHDLTKFISLSLTKIITDTAAAKFSWHGLHDNIPVKEYLIMKLLKETAITKFPGLSEKEVVSIIKRWFQRAKDRIRKRLKQGPYSVKRSS